MGRDARVTLAAVRRAALERNEAEAEAIRRAARRRAEQITEDGRAEAAGLVAARLAVAEALADLHERECFAQARAEARATVLGAQSTVLSEAVAAVRAAVAQLPGDPRYEQLLHLLAADARARLAPGGTVSITPAGEGGLVARAGSLSIDYSLPAQVDRMLDAMASELQGLWQ